MSEAEVDDDIIGEDPTMVRLQEAAARLLGKEAAIFVPSGTMANLIGLKVPTQPGQEVICSETAHIIHHEVGNMAWVSGLLARPIAAPDGYITASQVEELIRPGFFYMSSTGLVELENTMNGPGGRVFPQEHIDAVCELAHSRSIPVHMDGARLFNAAVASGVDPRRIVRDCDSVCFCLSKGLGTPAGSMLAGSRAFIEQAKAIRQMLGGGMRQTGILAAAGLYALEHNVERLAEDHANARLLGEGLAGIPGISVDLDTVETNMVYFDPTGTGLTADEFVVRLEERGVLTLESGTTSLRFVTHLDVSREEAEAAIGIVAEVASEG